MSNARAAAIDRPRSARAAEVGRGEGDFGMGFPGETGTLARELFRDRYPPRPRSSGTDSTPATPF